jgi:MFS family permease
MAAEPSRPDAPEPTADTAEVSAEQLSKAAEFIEEEEGAFSHFPGLLATATKFLLVAMSLFHLYAAVDIVPANVLRPVHVGWMLLLVFLLVPVSARYRNRLMWWDVACALLGVAGGGLLPLWGLYIAQGFGQANYGKAAGLMNPAMMPVTLLAAPFAGRVFDRTGHYTLAFVTFLAALAVAAVINGWLRLPRREAGA